MTISPDSIQTLKTSGAVDSELVALVRSGRVLVTGAGISGRGAVEMLKDIQCPEIILVDDNKAAASTAAAQLDISWLTTADAALLLDDAATVAIVTSPGWPPRTDLFSKAASAGVPVIGDVAVAFAADQSSVWGAPRKWLVVTGTNGKTTTTSMLAEMLGDRGAAVGNIGVAVHDALKSAERIDVLAAELSSFQLHWAPNLSPTAGVLLNLAEDHIDWHGSFENYGMDKAQALTGNVAVYGADDEAVCRIVDKLKIEGKLASSVVGFTYSEPAPGQVGVRDGFIVDRAFTDTEVVVAPVAGISPAGKAGVLDALAATALARSVGVTAKQIAEALGQFTVRAHRGQAVHSVAGIDWIDDSKATNPHAADAALSGHDSVVWVAGGQLKGAEIAPVVAAHARRFRHAAVLGVDREEIIQALRRFAPDCGITEVSTTDPELAMRQCCEAAAAAATPGDVVLLAPAAASLDMYTGMAQRGDLFAQFAVEVTGEDGQDSR